MTENVKKVLKAFTYQPYRATMGARTQAQRLGVNIEDVYEARRLFKDKRVVHTPKILILDIETAPMKAYVWKRWRENIYLDQTISEWYLLSWAGKWLGDKDAFGRVLTAPEISEENDSRILIDLHKTLQEADIVIAHNANRFDIPKLNTRFLLLDMPPTTPYRVIDTYEVVKKQFGFSSNSLDALATFFGFDNKDPHDFELWKQCLEGSSEALVRLFNYNKKDVEILEKVYLKLRPWIKNHPNIEVISNNNKPICPHCGSEFITEVKNKVYNTQHYKYPVFSCYRCGAVFRSKERVSNKKNLVPLS